MINCQMMLTRVRQKLDLEDLIGEAQELLDTAAINNAIQENDAVTLQAIIVEYGNLISTT